MQIPKKAIIAVADGEKLSMFRNKGDKNNVKLVALDHSDVDAAVAGSAAVGRTSSANPDGGKSEEAGFAIGIADMLNKRFLSGKVDPLIVIAAPSTLGELRKEYHKSLEAILVGEIAKDLTGHSIQEIEKAIAAFDA